MDLIIGGAYQGKLDYAKENFSAEQVFTCREDLPELDFSADTIDKLELFTLACVRSGTDARAFLEEKRECLESKIVICTDISQGVVPVDKENRIWREMTGRVLVYLAKEAMTVTRVFCGLGQRIKQNRAKIKSQINLIRHGITEGNKRRLYYGAADIPLAEEGIESLKKLVQENIYPGAENGDFYTTGMKRTEQTLELIYGKKEHETIDALREMDFGEFEMKSYEELKEVPGFIKWAEDNSGTEKSPGGESRSEFSARIHKGLKTLIGKHRLKELSVRHNGKAAVTTMICHGGTIAAIMEKSFPGRKEHFYKWIPDPGHGYTLTLEDGKIVDYGEF